MGVQNVPKEEVVVVIKGKKAISTDQGETSTVLMFVSGVGEVV